ncbi:MAG: FG-GAP-like repeat-containing protein, partial [Ilumatobacteraceae bacterium]
MLILGRADDPSTPATTVVTGLVMRPGAPGGFGPVEWIGPLPAQCIVGTYIAASAIADIDGDGSLDVVCGDSRMYVLFGDGNGGLEPALDLGFLDTDSSYAEYGDAHEFSVVDLDGDDLLDVVYVARLQTGVAGDPPRQAGNLIIGWSRQTEVGGEPAMAPVATVHEASPATSTSANVWFQARPVIADLTGDGKVDVAIVGTTADDRLTVFRNETVTAGDPVMTRAGQNDVFTRDDPDEVADVFYPYLAGLDADADGDVDMVASVSIWYGYAGPTGWTNVLLRNDGTGTFTPEALPGSDGLPDPVAIDIDDDGNTDLAWPSAARGVEIRRGRDDGSFALPVSIPVADRSVDWVDFTDVDDDGLVDLVAARNLYGADTVPYPTLVVARNTSTGLEGAPDLVVDEVASFPTRVEVTVANRGASVVEDGFTTSLWLSVDDVWDIDDVLLGEVDHMDTLLPGATSTAALTAQLLPVVAGAQHLIARTDPRRVVVESDENNNVGSTEVSLAVPELVIGGSDLSVTPTATRPGVARLAASAVPVRITVGGATGIVTTGGPDRVPTRTAAAVMLAGPGSFVLPAHAADSYLRVEGSGSVALSAVALPFGVARVAPRVVGRTGDATLLISGVVLDASMTVELVKGATRIAASSVIAVGDDLAATMPMSGAVLGAYDLVVTDGAESSTLSGAVNVQSPSATIGDGDVNQLVLSTFAPTRVLGGSAYDYIITYANRGLTDIVAPFLEVHVDAAQEPAGSVYDFDQPFFVVPEVIGAPAGVLPPGSTGRIRIPFLPSSSYGFSLEVYSAQTSLPHDWEQELADDPAGALTQDEYDSVLAELAELAGTTSGSY